MKDKVHMQNLERRVEDMLYAHRNERTAYIVQMQHLTQQLIDTNNYLLNVGSQQITEIATLRAELHHLIQQQLLS